MTKRVGLPTVIVEGDGGFFLAGGDFLFCDEDLCVVLGKHGNDLAACGVNAFYGYHVGIIIYPPAEALPLRHIMIINPQSLIHANLSPSRKTDNCCTDNQQDSQPIAKHLAWDLPPRRGSASAAYHDNKSSILNPCQSIPFS